MPIGTPEEWRARALANAERGRQEGWREHQTRRCVLEPILAFCGIDVWDPACCIEGVKDILTRTDFPQSYQQETAVAVEGYWVDTCFSAENCVEVSRWLLSTAGLDPNDLDVQWEEPAGR